jgi:uncharacterized repeat protein (TIGR03803 family)
LLHAFNGNDGNEPLGLALGPDGNLYGTTAGGGLAQQGTLFRITPEGQFTTLHLLSASEGGVPAAAPVFGADGLLYGTTSTGGRSLRGTAFRFDALAPQPPEAAMTKVCSPMLPDASPGSQANGCRPVINLYVGESFRIDWSTANLSSCTASGSWSGPQPTAGHLEVFPLHKGIYRYALSCTGPGGTRTVSQTVTVGPPL